MITFAYGAYRIGHAYPRISLLFSALAFCTTILLGFLIATDKGDGPGQAVGVAIVGFFAFFMVVISIAFLAGSIIKLAAMTRIKPK